MNHGTDVQYEALPQPMLHADMVLKYNFHDCVDVVVASLPQRKLIPTYENYLDYVLYIFRMCFCDRIVIRKRCATLFLVVFVGRIPLTLLPIRYWSVIRNRPEPSHTFVNPWRKPVS